MYPLVITSWVEWVGQAVFRLAASLPQAAAALEYLAEF